jgi:16S rRNA G966 N2-methylase RsmD
MKVMTLKENNMIEIKQEFKDLIPPLTKEEFKQLENNCMSEGIREKILTWNGFIIDGHNRYEIATRWDLDFETESKHFDNEEAVKEWMILNQFGRRNLSNYQRSVLALELEDVFSKKAKENQIRTSENRVRQISDKQEIDTKKELSKVASVSHDTIAKVKKIQEKAPEEVKAKLRTGEVSINAAYKEIKKEEKKEKKENERDRLAEIGKNKKIEIDFRLGDFEEVFKDIPDGSIDCIITDPPYPKEFIEVWSKLSRFAKRVLKPNGYCISYSGQMHLPEVMKRMGENLDYYWSFALMHTGSRQLINGRSLFCGWKPILVYQNGFSKLKTPFDDFINGSGMEKKHHNWQQSEMELKHLIDNFTVEGDTILEPFAGSGTTILAALKNNRNVIGAEINEKSFNIAKQRISEWKN